MKYTWTSWGVEHWKREHARMLNGDHNAHVVAWINWR